MVRLSFITVLAICILRNRLSGGRTPGGIANAPLSCLHEISEVIEDCRQHRSRKPYLPVHVFGLEKRDLFFFSDDLKNRDSFDVVNSLDFPCHKHESHFSQKCHYLVTHDLRLWTPTRPMRRGTRRCEGPAAASGAKVGMADRCLGPNAVVRLSGSGVENARPTQRVSLRWLARALSQTARQSLPHRPWHLNSFDRPPICPPHSGQTKFRIADMHSALMPVNAALINCIHSSQTRACRRSRINGGN